MAKVSPTSSAGGGGAGGPRVARKTGSTVAPFTVAAQRASKEQINAKQVKSIRAGVKRGFSGK